jgi:hypothetical protein
MGIIFVKASDAMKKKVVEKYLVIDEVDGSIEQWCDSYAEAEKYAKDFATKRDSDDVVILKISDAFRVYIPEEPQVEVRPMNLDEL